MPFARTGDGAAETKTMSKRGQNEGSIYRTNDGRWRGAVSRGWKTNAEGKPVPIRKWLTGETRAEVSRKLTDELKRKEQGLPMVGERQTVGEFMKHWLEHVVKTKVRPKTFESYEWITEKHLIPHLGRIPLAKLTPQQLQAFINERLKSGRLPKAKKEHETESAAAAAPEQTGTPPSEPDPSLKPRTVQHIHATLRTALDQAEQWGLVARNVASLVNAPRVQRLEVEPLSPDEARKFLEAVRDDRLEALYSVATAIGLRQGEALGLRWPDIDLVAKTLTVQNALQRVDGKLQLVEVKTKKSRRTVNLPQFAVSALWRHQARQEQERQFAGDRWGDTGFVFTTTVGTPLDGSTVTHRFQRALKAAGMRRIRFHDLRHSAASLLLAQGVHPKVVQEIGGWSNIQIVLDTYSHLIPALKSEAAEKMDSMLNPAPVSVAARVAAKPDSAKAN
jgi:integrase